MNILLTNDDGCDAPGLHAAYQAVKDLGRIFVVAPAVEQSGCSHTLTLRRSILVHPRRHHEYGDIFAVDGTPADCVRLAIGELIQEPVDLVVSGINRGANAGIDHFYSGTVAAAREAAILGIRAIALSQSLRKSVEVDWEATQLAARIAMDTIWDETLPSPGFWSINLPSPIPVDSATAIMRVPMSVDNMPVTFQRIERDGGRTLEFSYGASYWDRETTSTSDFGVIRNGHIAICKIPLYQPFPEM